MNQRIQYATDAQGTYEIEDLDYPENRGEYGPGWLLYEETIDAQQAFALAQLAGM